MSCTCMAQNLAGFWNKDSGFRLWGLVLANMGLQPQGLLVFDLSLRLTIKGVD